MIRFDAIHNAVNDGVSKASVVLSKEAINAFKPIQDEKKKNDN